RMEPLLDRLGRPLETLRISITDRCNFRCVYCMPKEVYGRDHAFLERRALLTFEEIARLARLFARLGVRTIRLTGGEPLVRRDVERLVALLHAIPGLELALTTNGALLTQKAEALARAGLDRVTVSLDSVDDATFRALNDVDFPVQKVLDGIDAAAAAWPLEPVAPARADETAKRWRYRDGAGELGVIASVTEPFCGGCSRARLSAEGRLHTCLFATAGHDLRGPLRLGASDEELEGILRTIWGGRSDRYSELRTAETAALPKIEMSYIGG